MRSGELLMILSSIGSTAENFFLCTNIPVKAFSLDGSLIHSAGYTEELDKFFQENSIYNLVTDELRSKENQSYITINYKDSINFTVSYSCCCQANKDIFILGPYTGFKEKSSKNIIFKPNHCIPHLISLLNSLKNTPQLESERLNPSCNSYISRALKYVQSNFHKPITLEDVSKHIGINKCYFCDLFKKETGKTYSKLLNDLRIEKSKELLLNKNLSILEVSLSVGFNNQNYFNVIFKKLTNRTPLEFRAENAA